MTKTLLSILTCGALMAASAGQPDSPVDQTADRLGTAGDHAVQTASPPSRVTDFGQHRMSAEGLALTTGSGPAVEATCGAAAGAGLALALSGVLAPVGIGLGVVGVACAMFA